MQLQVNLQEWQWLWPLKKQIKKIHSLSQPLTSQICIWQRIGHSAVSVSNLRDTDILRNHFLLGRINPHILIRITLRWMGSWSIQEFISQMIQNQCRKLVCHPPPTTLKIVIRNHSWISQDFILVSISMIISLINQSKIKSGFQALERMIPTKEKTL